LFAHTAADCVELGMREHDEVMGWVLGLSHLVNIAFAAALGRSGDLVPMLQKISSTTFDHQLRVAAQVVSENPRLYYEIQAGTVPGAGAVEAFSQSLGELVEAIAAGDEDRFVAIMDQARGRLAAGQQGPGQ
jgi:chorismate mutase/prephenate dehydrogenase